MPRIIELNGYIIFFWANENNEPCHVHAGKNRSNSSKIWIEPEVKVEHNKAQIPPKDLNRIEKWLKKHRAEILQQWNEFFGN